MSRIVVTQYMSLDGVIRTWNAGAERFKGYSADQIIGEHFSIFYTDEDVEREHPEEELRIAAADGSYEEEGIRVRKDGSHFWASVLITALRNEEGDLRGFAKVTRDKIMTGAARRYRGYGFQRHKGYGTDEHWAALRRLGPSAYHRHSFTGVAAPWATGHPAVTIDQEAEGECQ